MAAATGRHPIKDVLASGVYIKPGTSSDPLHVFRFAKHRNTVNGSGHIMGGRTFVPLATGVNVIEDRAVREVLSEYRRRMEAEDALRSRLPRQEWLQRRDEFLLEVGEAVATLMHILVREAKAKTILEVGTSYGY